jgi:hypothetical protein
VQWQGLMLHLELSGLGIVKACFYVRNVDACLVSGAVQYGSTGQVT